MKSKKYSNFCLKIFGKKLSEKQKNKQEDKEIILEQAGIKLDYKEYYSIALMNILIGFICALLFSIILYIIIPGYYTKLLIFLTTFSVPFCLGLLYLYLPLYHIKRRAANIDLFLPYAINYINSMAVAGISPVDIFSTLATIDAYGEIQKEAKKIVKEIKVMGVDNISALKHALTISPSRKLKNFLQGIIGTIQSGSDLHVYLSNIVDKYMDDDLRERKKDLNLLAVTGEVFVISAIAFPIFLVIILTAMGFFGGSMDLSILILYFFSFLVLPFIYIGFYVLIKSTSIEKIVKIRSKKKYDLKNFYEENKKTIIIVFLTVYILLSFYVLVFLMTLWGAFELNHFVLLDVLFITILILITPIGIFKYAELRNKNKIQERVPEFLIEISDSIATGMNIFDSVKVAERGRYGELSPEIKKMKAQLSWDISIKEVLENFASRMKSAVIQRIVITINKGLMMGGNTPKIFKAAAREVDQINQLEEQRKADMSLYTMIILLCFFIFLAIILVLNSTFFASFFDIQNQQVTGVEGPLVYNSVSPVTLEYALYSFVFVQSIGAGILSGFMMDGKLSSGVRYCLILGIISIIIFKFII